MEEKVLNRGFLIYIAICILPLIPFFLPSEMESDYIAIAVIVIAMGAVMAVFTPYMYKFDSEGISFCYILGVKHRYLWKDVDFIICSTTTSRRSEHDEYEIVGKPEKNHRVFKAKTIIKTKKIQACMVEYAQLKVTDLTAYYSRNDFKLSNFQTIESGLRAEIEKHISRYYAELSYLSLNLKYHYAYTLDDDINMTEYSEKPIGDSTYGIYLEICRHGETDKNKMVCYDISLIEFKEKKPNKFYIYVFSIVFSLKQFDEMIKEIKDLGFERCLEEYMEIEDFNTEE